MASVPLSIWIMFQAFDPKKDFVQSNLSGERNMMVIKSHHDFGTSSPSEAPKAAKCLAHNLIVSALQCGITFTKALFSKFASKPGSKSMLSGRSAIPIHKEDCPFSCILTTWSSCGTCIEASSASKTRLPCSS
jgi:hypothetical protein